jgi:hypothetical protein
MSLITRLVIFIVFVSCIYFIPWWLLFAGVFIIMLIKRVVLFELILPAFMIDVIYGVPLVRFYNFQFVATLIFVFILLIIFLIKKYIRA